MHCQMLHCELPELRVPFQIQRGGVQRVHHAGLGQRCALVRRGRKHDIYVTIHSKVSFVSVDSWKLDGEPIRGCHMLG